MAPIGEIAPGVPKKEKEISFENVIAPGAILRMMMVVSQYWYQVGNKQRVREPTTNVFGSHANSSISGRQ